MLADRADLRSLLANDDMAAVGAFPDAIFIARENYRILDILKQFPVSFLMGFLYGSYAGKQERYVIETFFFGSLGETSIHVGPLVIFTSGSILEIYLRRWHLTAMEYLEPYLSMLFLVASSVLEKLAYLNVAIFSGL